MPEDKQDEALIAVEHQSVFKQVIKQIHKDIQKPLKEQVMPLILAFSTALFSFLFKLVDLTPIFNAAIAVIVALAFYFLFAGIRAPFIVIRNQKEQIASLTQRLQEALGSNLKPNLEYILTSSCINTNNGVIQTNFGSDFFAYMIEIRNRASEERQVASFNHVRANITYSDSNNQTWKYIDVGVWVKEETDSVSLQVGASRQLFIAMRDHRGLHWIARRNHEDNNPFEILSTFIERYRVKVELIDEDTGSLIDDYKFFDLALIPEFEINPVEPAISK